MRLGQLSRQLEVSSDKIVKVLADNFREVNNHPNIKITEEELAFLVVHFSPSQTESNDDKDAPLSELIEEKIEIESESESEPSAQEKKNVPEFVESLRPQIITLEEEFNAQKEDLESYKAEKVELEGLKVVGKIELPEPPIRKEKPTTGTENKEEESEEIKSFKRKPRRNGNRKPRLNPIEYQRQKEERQAEKRKEQEEKRKKELKKKHYETQVKSKQQPVKKKKKRHAATLEKPRIETLKPSPVKSSNPLKRFWLWLNGAYDK